MIADRTLSLSGREGRLISALTDVVPTGEGPEGPGDDAALLCVGPHRVLSTDALVEDVHFVRAHPPEWLGWKVLASSLSDLAAMGALPEAFTLAAAVPDDMPDAWWRLFGKGMAEYAKQAGVVLAGGDVVASPGPAMFTVTCWGHLEARRALQRGTVEPGFGLWVAGHLGRSRVGLQRWLELAKAQPGWSVQPPPAEWAEDPLLLAHLRPDPPLSVGPAALKAGAVAGLDISDGLWLDASRMARASGVDLMVDVEALPDDAALLDVPPKQRLLGGEDYALLLAAPELVASALKELGCAQIGRAVTAANVRESTVLLRRSGEVVAAIDEAPFHHFPDANDDGASC